MNLPAAPVEESTTSKYGKDAASLQAVFDKLPDLSLGDVDPTSEYTWSNETNIWELPLGETNSYIATLKEDRILVVGCFDPTLKLSIKRTFYNHFDSQEFATFCDIREVRFGQEKPITINNLLDNRIGGDRRGLVPVVIFADLTSVYSDNFFVSITEIEDGNKKRTVQEILQERNMYLLIYLKDHQETLIYKGLPKDKQFHFWDVPVYEQLIILYFHDEGTLKTTEILSKLKAQRSLWTQSDETNEEEFVKAINELLDRNRKEASKQALFNKITEYEDAQKATERRILLENRSPEKLLVSESDSLNRYIIFVATFFPNLTNAEFREVLELLLDAEEQLRYKKDDDLTLLNQWHQNPDKHLQNAQLRTVFSDERQVKVRDFIEGFSRAKLVEFFEDYRPTDMENFFIRLVYEKQLIFNTYPNGYVFDGLLKLYALLAESAPNTYINQFLIKLLIPSINLQGIENLSGRELDVLLVQLTEKKDWEYRVLAICINKLAGSKRGNVAAAIDNLFDVLIRYRQKVGSDRLQSFDDIAYQLINYLKYTIDFDTIGRFKQLLAGATEVVKSATYGELVKLLVSEGSPSVLNNYIDAIFKWVADERQEDDWLKKQIDRMVLDYSVAKIRAISYEEYGNENSEFTLFEIAKLPGQDSEVVLQAIVKRFFDYLNHPDWDQEPRILSMVIEEWYAILLGLDESKWVEHPNQPLASQLLKTIIKYAPKEFLAYFNRYFDQQVRYYCEEKNGARDKEKKKHYKNLIVSLRSLQKTYKDLKINS